jgi:hypothetical protein
MWRRREIGTLVCYKQTKTSPWTWKTETREWQWTPVGGNNLAVKRPGKGEFVPIASARSLNAAVMYSMAYEQTPDIADDSESE